MEASLTFSNSDLVKRALVSDLMSKKFWSRIQFSEVH